MAGGRDWASNTRWGPYPYPYSLDENIRAVQLINRVRGGVFSRSRYFYFVSVLAFFSNRLGSIGLI